MKQKLIAIGDEGCRFAASMLDEGLFADATVDFCDNSVRRLLKYDHVDCNMIISTSVFMQGRIVLHEHDGFNNEASRMVIEMLKREGTDFSASDVVDYCKKLRNKYPYKPDDRIVVQPDNYPWASFEERAETYNSNVGYRRKIC